MHLTSIFDATVTLSVHFCTTTTPRVARSPPNDSVSSQTAVVYLKTSAWPCWKRPDGTVERSTPGTGRFPAHPRPPTCNRNVSSLLRHHHHTRFALRSWPTKQATGIGVEKGGHCRSTKSAESLRATSVTDRGDSLGFPLHTAHWLYLLTVSRSNCSCSPAGGRPLLRKVAPSLIQVTSFPGCTFST